MTDERIVGLGRMCKVVVIDSMVTCAVAWIGMMLWNKGPAALYCWAEVNFITALFFAWAWMKIAQAVRGQA